MKKSSALIMSFLLLALLDSLLAFAMPIDFTYQHVSIVWHACFIGMLVYLHDKPWKTRLLCGLFVGLVLDYFFEGSFPFCTIVYPLFALAAGIFMEYMENNRIAFLVYLASCFLLDFLPYVYQRMVGITNIDVWRWLYCTQMVTTFVNGILILTLMYLHTVMVRFFLIQRSRAKREARRKRFSRNRLQA